MLKTEYEILSYIRKHPNCQWTEILNALDPQNACNDTNRILSYLLEANQIEIDLPNTPPICRVDLPPHTLQSLLQYEDQCAKAAEEAEEERQRRKEERRFTAKISLMIAAVGGAIGFFGTVIGSLISG